MEISDYIRLAGTIYQTRLTHPTAGMTQEPANPFGNDCYACDNYGIIIPEGYSPLWHQKTRVGLNKIFEKVLPGQGICLTGATIIEP